MLARLVIEEVIAYASHLLSRSITPLRVRLTLLGVDRRNLVVLRIAAHVTQEWFDNSRAMSEAVGGALGAL